MAEQTWPQVAGSELITSFIYHSETEKARTLELGCVLIRVSIAMKGQHEMATLMKFMKEVHHWSGL